MNKKLANEMFFKKEFIKSIFYYTLNDSVHDDWELVRTATCFSNTIGVKYAYTFLQKFFNNTRKVNFLYAMMHYHYLSDGNTSSVVQFFRDNVINNINLDSSNVGVDYLISVIKCLLHNKDFELALSEYDKYKHQLKLFSENMWGARVILREFAKRVFDKEKITILLIEYKQNSSDNDLTFNDFLDLHISLHDVSTQNFIKSDIKLTYNKIFNSDFSYVSAVNLARSFLNSEHYLDSTQILNLAISSLINGHGFSFLRMGDGEGRFVRKISSDKLANCKESLVLELR